MNYNNIKICKVCKKELSKDEIALNKKLIAKDITYFLCIECLAELLGCDTDALINKINKYKEQGCDLFI